MSFSNINVNELLANTITGAAGTKFILNTSTNQALKDGVNHGVADLASQVINLEGFLPLPDSLAYLARDVANGIWYVVVNMANDVSPFDGNWQKLLYGVAISLISTNVTTNLIGAVESI